MSEILEATVDKFTFKVPTDRLYTVDHLWVKPESGLVAIGLSDYLQQRSGDVAFAEPNPAGTELSPGDELANIETMKTTLVLPSPLSGVIKTVNPRLADEPELVNQDPYGEGWLVQLEPSNWLAESQNLLKAEVYYEEMKTEAEVEAKKL
jgi:glycine cleavage system H protein